MAETYTLKVNIHCCKACPKKLHKMLENFKGVESFKIEKEKRIVSITGKFNFDQLFKKIKKMKKNAELIKKESSDPEKKQQSKEENNDYGNNHDYQNGFSWPNPAYQDPNMMQYGMPVPPPHPNDPSTMQYGMPLPPPHPSYQDPRMRQYARPPPPPPHGYQDPRMMRYARAPPPPPPRGVFGFLKDLCQQVLTPAPPRPPQHDFYGPVYYQW